jgi:hypothetical protein
VPGVVGVPKSSGKITFTTPGPVRVEPPTTPNLSPGGIDPVSVHDWGGEDVAGTDSSANATAAICEPSVTVYGLGWPGEPVESV